MVFVTNWRLCTIITCTEIVILYVHVVVCQITASLNPHPLIISFPLCIRFPERSLSCNDLCKDFGNVGVKHYLVFTPHNLERFSDRSSEYVESLDLAYHSYFIAWPYVAIDIFICVSYVHVWNILHSPHDCFVFACYLCSNHSCMWLGYPLFCTRWTFNKRFKVLNYQNQKWLVTIQISWEII